MPTLNVTEEELKALDMHLDSGRDGWDSGPEAPALADLHDKIRDLRNHPRRGRTEGEEWEHWEDNEA